MSLSGFAVKRPVTVIMLALICLVLGGIALVKLPVDLFPEMNMPIAVVLTTYEGAGPSEVETLVTRPLEEVLVTVDNVASISSSSTQGQSMVVVELDWGTNMDIAMLEMRERIDRIKPYLPDGADSPLVLKFDPTDLPIQEYAITGNMGLDKLRVLVEETIKPRLERVDGVASVQVSGGLERQIQILLDPGKMKTYGISLDQVAQSLMLSNLNLPGGTISHESNRLTVRTVGEFESLEDLESVAVPGAQGLYYLKDIAEIRDTYKDLTQHARVNGRESIGISIQKASQANALEVAERVRKALAEISRDFGKDIKISMISDQSIFVRLAVDAVTSNAITGGILAILVLFVFLRSIKSTLVIALSIPISIVTTFALIYFADMTLNMLTLGGLALGIGMLVDNSIVVLENIFRFRTQGVESHEAAMVGADEVGMAIAASTLTTVAVFLPIVFVEGITSEIFRALSFTVSFSLLVSLLVAITLVPMLASRLLTSVGTYYSRERDETGKSGILERILAWYRGFLEKAISMRWLVIAISAILVAISFSLIPVIGREFLPDMDEGLVSIRVEMSKGSPLERTDSVVRYIEEQLEKIPEVETVLSVVGSGEETDTARLSVRLVSQSERKKTTAMVMEDIRSRIGNIQTAEITVLAVSNLTGDLASAGVQVDLRGDDIDELKRVTEKVAEVIRGVPGVREVSSTIEEQRPELQISVNRKKAATYGLTPVQIASAVRAAIEGHVATKYKADGGEVDVLVRLTEEGRRDLAALKRLPLPTPLGIMVPLEEVAEVSEGLSPVVIDRLQQARAASLYIQVYGVDTGTVKKNIDARIKELNLPSSIEYGFGGESQWMDEAFNELVNSLILAAVLVYMILASQFESIWQPFVIMFSVPFAFVGVVIALLITGSTLNVASLIGVIMLVGIVVNNAIVLVDYINQLREKGTSRHEAILLAGTARLRPVLMTTLTTVLGLVPVAMGIGEGGELMSSLGAVVMGGLSVSTVLSLVIVPIVYIVLEDAIKFFSRFFKRTPSTGQSAGPREPGEQREPSVPDEPSVQGGPSVQREPSVSNGPDIVLL